MIGRLVSSMLRWIAGDWTPDRSAYLADTTERAQMFARHFEER